MTARKEKIGNLSIHSDPFGTGSQGTGKEKMRRITTTRVPDPMEDDADAVQKLTETVMQLKLELAEARTSLDVVSDEKSHLRCELAAERNKLQDVTEERDKLKEQLRKLKGKMLGMKEKVRALERERAETRVKLEVAEVERDEYRNKSKNLLSRTEHLTEQRNMLQRNMLSAMVDEENDSVLASAKERRTSSMLTSLGSIFSTRTLNTTDQSFGEFGVGTDSGQSSLRTSWQNTSRRSSGGFYSGASNTSKAPVLSSDRSLKMDGNESLDINDLCNRKTAGSGSSCHPSQNPQNVGVPYGRRGSDSTAKDVDSFFDSVAGNAECARNLESESCYAKRRADTGSKRRANSDGDGFLAHVLRGVFIDDGAAKTGKRCARVKRNNSYDDVERAMELLLNEKSHRPLPGVECDGIPSTRLGNIVRRNSFTPAEA